MHRFVKWINSSIVAQSVLFGLAYYIGVEIGQALSYTFWPPAGLFVATLAVSRNAAWLPVIAAAWCAKMTSNFIHDISVPVAICLLIANTVEACVGSLLLRRFIGSSTRLATVKDVLVLTGTSVLIGPTFGATIGAATLVASSDASFWPAWQAWWIADAIGVLLVAPLLIVWINAPAPGQVRPARVLEVLIVFACLILMTQSVYGNWLPPVLRVPIFILPILLWAGLRLGLRGITSSLFLLALIGAWHVSRGRGPFATEGAPITEALLRSQASLGIISLSFLLLAAVVAERRQAEADLLTALAEIKTLRGLIPICAWCKRMRDDKSFWLSVEDYVAQHTEARFSHGMCPECLSKEMNEPK